MESCVLDEPVARVLPEDMLRAQIYKLLSNFLKRPPTQQLLDITSTIQGNNDTDLGRALDELSQTASSAELEPETEAYDTLFIGLGRGKLLPYGSHYLTGFLNEKPLAELRETMSHYGIARKPEESDPEDHIGSVMEMMSGIIEGAYGAPFCLEEQKIFFEKHVNNWALHFFEDLSKEDQLSKLYAAIGKLGKAYIDVERASFEMSP